MNITVENLEKELKQGKLRSLYLFYGEEQFLLEQCVKKIRHLFGEAIKGINDIAIDETNVSELISDIETPSFGYERKIIIAKNTGLFKKEARKKGSEMQKEKEKVAKFLQENQESIDKTVVLIFIESEVEKQTLYKIIEQNGVICEFNFQKPMILIKRLQAIAQGYNVTIDQATAQYLLECAGTNMQELVNEIRKLIEYAGNGGTITKKNIDQLTIKKLESVIFDLTDNLGKRNLSQALIVFHNLIREKEPLPKILITLYNHFKKLYQTTLAVRYGQEVTGVLNLKPNQSFLVNKYKMQARYFEETELRCILQDLIELDGQFKSGQMDLQIGLETIFCHYCGKK
jgi:DNA polymerase-3 subunit delta